MVKKSRLIPNWFQLLMASLLAPNLLWTGEHCSLFTPYYLHFKTFFLVSLEFPESRLNVITASVWETVAKRVQIRSCRRSCKQRFTWLFSVADGDQPPPELIWSTTTTGSNEHVCSFIASLIRASWHSSNQAEELHADEQLLYILRLLSVTAVLVCRRQQREVAGRWM